MKKQISIICIYNDEELVRKMCSSIDFEDVDYILIDNRKNVFKSAVEAYYSVLPIVATEIVCFCHQDIIFYENAINDIIQALNRKKDIIVGAAGAGEKGGICSSMYCGQENWTCKYNTIKDKAKEVQTLDECLFACRKKLFDTGKIKFDMNICDGWHLYAADLCLNARTKGIYSYAIPLNLRHLSTGNADKNFYIVLKRLAQKYKSNYKKIYITSAWTYTNLLLSELLFKYRQWRKLF